MTIPYLVNFTPYTFSGELCQSIDDMVSVSVQQQFSFTDINYDIGSDDDVQLPILIKNITNNARLTVEIIADKNVFIINGNDALSNVITLAPNETKQLSVSLNKNRLNESVGLRQTNIKLVIKNITNGGIVTRDVGVSNLDIRYLTDRLL